MRLIDADALTPCLVKFASDGCIYKIVFASDVEHAATIDAEPVRRGEWTEMVFTDTGKFAGYKCSECGLIARKKSSYCHCGAKMDGGAEECR